MAGISFVTVATDDLAQAVGFYCALFDIPKAEVRDGDDHVALTLDGGFSLVLYPREKIAEVAGQPVVKSSSEFILSVGAADAAEVESILARGVAAGGVQPAPVAAEAWGASGHIIDPDGHLCEVVCFST